MPLGGQLHTLDCLEGGPGCVLNSGSAILGLPNTAGGINPCSPSFIGETDKMRIRKSVLQRRELRPLSVFKMEGGRSIEP